MSSYDSIVITGAGGMLGHALAEALAARGHVARGFSHAQCDIADESQRARLFDPAPTLLLNCAAFTQVDRCETEREKADAVNGYAVGQLAQRCRQCDALLVHVSTDFVFDGALGRPYRPDDPVHPLQAYGQSKLLGETELQRHVPRDWLIVRTAWVYGRHGNNFPRTMITAARAGKPLAVVADQIGSPTYAPDLAEAMLALLEVGARGIWHVTNFGQASWLEFARAALAEFGLDNPVAPLTSEQWRQRRPDSSLRPTYTVLDTQAFAQATGRPPRPWRQALKDFHAAVQRDGF